MKSSAQRPPEGGVTKRVVHAKAPYRTTARGI